MVRELAFCMVYNQIDLITIFVTDIKTFYGTSENAVKTQVWIAISVYVLVAIMKKQLRLQESLYTILQILSVTSFERTSLIQLITERDCKIQEVPACNQLKLFE